MAVVTMRQLLESGVHFGHQTRRWNPKMKRFIFTERNGIYIIDLRQTLDYINKAYDYVKHTVAEGGTILFVGTKKQAQEAIAEQASRVGMPYVNHRWLGGMLTNFQTVHKRLARMKELEALDLSGTAEGYTKKETLQLSREKAKLTRTLGGLRDMQKLPSAVCGRHQKEHRGRQARKLASSDRDPDTNCDPIVDYPIPATTKRSARRAADPDRRQRINDGLIARRQARGGVSRNRCGCGGSTAGGVGTELLRRTASRPGSSAQPRRPAPRSQLRPPAPTRTAPSTL